LLLLFTISLIRPIIKGLAAKETLPAQSNQAVLQKIQLNVRIIFFFLIFILLGKVIFLLAFPFDINHFDYRIGATSDALVFFNLQIVFIILYASILSLVVFHDKLKPEYRYYFLNKVLFFTLVLSSAEVLISSVLYIIQQYQFLWSVNYATGLLHKFAFVNSLLKPGNLPLFLVMALGLFLVYSVLFIWNIRRFNPLLQKILFVLVLSGLFLYHLFILNAWQLLFGSTVATEKVFSLFLPGHGMSGTIWSILISIAVVSQILAFFINLLKDKFMAVQLNTHYRLQLNRVSYYGFSGLLLLLLWPWIMFWFFK